MVERNQLVCNAIHSTFLRTYKFNSHTLLNLSVSATSPLLFDKPNARQCHSHMTDLYIIQHLRFKLLRIYTYKHTYIQYIFRSVQMFKKSTICLKILGVRRMTCSKFHAVDPRILGTLYKIWVST